MSQRFCGSCNRLRVTASGELKLCLYGRGRYPLDFSSPEVIEAQVRRWATEKPEKHELESGQHGHVATFRKIGG
jgi:cyclic pyranopterin phosphate synthase